MARLKEKEPSEATTAKLLQHFEDLLKVQSLLEIVINDTLITKGSLPPLPPAPVPPPPPPPKEYYLTIIMVLRNDNYGGRMDQRLKNWLEIFSYEANAVGFAEDVEVLFVEWNPVAGEPLEKLMKTVLPPNKKFPLRIITVPKEIHNSIQNPRNIQVFEYMAKNVGMRRARGKFILCTNPDSLFNPEVVGFLAKKKLSTRGFYTMFRTFDNFYLPDGTTQQKIEAVQQKSRSYFGHAPDPMAAQLCNEGGIPEDRFPNRGWPIDDAPGDFYMISKEGAHKFHGFSQRPQNFNLDSYILCMSHAHGFTQLIPYSPCIVVHQPHDRPGSYGAVTGDWNFNAFCGSLLSQKSPMYPPGDDGGENWGWADQKFEEVTL